MKKPEILAPAGDMTSLQAALDSGADAVYLGLDAFNMRHRASANFTREELPEASRRCRERGVRLYMTLNSIIYEGELAAVEDMVAFAKPYVDAMIVSDWGVIEILKRHQVPVHVSTQMSCSNSAAAKFLKSQGVSRIVLARECTLDEVKRIVAESGVEIETFVHGAQCVALSGRCLLSHHAYGCSAQRGECRQPCRRRFLIKAIDRFTGPDGKPVHESEAEFVVEPHTVLSAKDLCSLKFVDRLVDVGISSFKIEGRARNPEYVSTVVKAYREAVDAVFEGRFDAALADRLEEEVKKVFHREFESGLFFGRPGNDQFTDVEDSAATEVKRHVGVVLDYFLKASVAQIKIEDNYLKKGVQIQIQGPTTGVVRIECPQLHRDGEVPEIAERGTWVTIKCPRVRVGDKVFIMAKKG